MTADGPDAPPDAALWDFCLRIYSEPGVEEACLRLQDEHGVDISLLLAILWSAVEGPGILTAGELDDLDSLVASWRENVVRPLRRVRRWMKAAGYADAPLRARVKADELAAERRELALIADWLAHRPAARRGGEVGAALRSVLGWMGCDAADVAALVEAVYRRSR